MCYTARLNFSELIPLHLLHTYIHTNQNAQPTQLAKLRVQMWP